MIGGSPIMIEVYNNLFVGDERDYEFNVSRQDGWAVVHACKEPYHRQALGYTSRGAPKNHPEYLFARRGNRLFLNIVDVDNPSFFAKEMICQALDFMDEALSNGLRVLVHCNLGESRSPSIALLYMATRLNALPTESLNAAEDKFKTIYQFYNPKFGLREHIRISWLDYCKMRSGE
jgi:hypothetical protein